MTDLTTLRQALQGCPECDWEEGATGGLTRHCDECCRKVTTVAWQLVVDGDRDHNPLERHLQAACKLLASPSRLGRTFNKRTDQAGFLLDGKWAGVTLRDVVAELVRRKK